MEQLKEIMRETLADDEFFALIAQANWKTYTALIAAGFAPDAALKIVAAQGPGLKSS